jgi:uncharacterized protein (TIGR02246 family)
MRGFLASIAVTGIILMSTGCTQTLPDTREADAKAISETEEAWAKVGLARDVDKFVTYYADDAVLLLPNEPPLVGREAIAGGLKPLLSDPNFSITFHASKVEVAKSGDMGYTRGRYTMTVTDTASKKVVSDKGTYVTCWRKSPDGTWKATVDTTISEIPVSAPAK